MKNYKRLFFLFSHPEEDWSTYVCEHFLILELVQIWSLHNPINVDAVALGIHIINESAHMDMRAMLNMYICAAKYFISTFSVKKTKTRSAHSCYTKMS